MTNLRNSVSPGVRMFLAEFIKICKVWSSGVKMKLKDSLHSHTFSVILLRRNVFLRNSVYVSDTMLIITFFSYKVLQSMDTRGYKVKVIIAFLVVFWSLNDVLLKHPTILIFRCILPKFPVFRMDKWTCFCTCMRLYDNF